MGYSRHAPEFFRLESKSPTPKGHEAIGGIEQTRRANTLNRLSYSVACAA
jgi:hypothetical protein